jgi:hypothetical protein
LKKLETYSSFLEKVKLVFERIGRHHWLDLDTKNQLGLLELKTMSKQNYNFFLMTFRKNITNF